MNPFHTALQELHTGIAELGGLVEESIGKAVTSLHQGDAALAEDVFDRGDLIDRSEVAIEESCVNILTLFQPVARDLRFLVTVLKVNNELEHMGDLTESIARKTNYITRDQIDKSKINLQDMGQQTQKMVGLALDALLEEDSNKAREVIKMDDQIDRYHSNNHKIVAERIKREGHQFTVEELGLLSVSRSLERIADMATSIAEDVIYFVDANIVRHRKLYQDI